MTSVSVETLTAPFEVPIATTRPSGLKTELVASSSLTVWVADNC